MSTINHSTTAQPARVAELLKEREIVYNIVGKDFDCYYYGVYIGSARTYLDGENKVEEHKRTIGAHLSEERP